MIKSIIKIVFITITMSFLDGIIFYNQALYDCLYECSHILIKYQEGPNFLDYKHLFIGGVFKVPSYEQIALSSIKIIFYSLLIINYYKNSIKKKSIVWRMTLILSVILSVIDFVGLINYKYPFLSFFFNLQAIHVNSICSYGKPGSIEIFYRIINIIIQIPFMYLLFNFIRSILLRKNFS